MGGPEGVLAVERYALVTGPVGGMAMHAVPRQPPSTAEQPLAPSQGPLFDGLSTDA